MEDKKCKHDWQCYGVADTVHYKHSTRETAIKHFRACKNCGRVEEIKIEEEK